MKTRFLNNYSISEAIFDKIAIWQRLDNPKQSLQSLIGDIEKILDDIQEKGRKSAIKEERPFIKWT